MPDYVNGEPLHDVGQSGKIQHVLGNAIERALRPGAVAMSTQIERVDVVILAERARHPVPVARVVESAVDQDHDRLAVGAPVPELKF